jgi:hypothetical protein
MVTIGVYGFHGESFLQRLRQADARLLIDVRQRRGVRGSEYAWANSLRLQAALARAQIAYEHHPRLAPTTHLPPAPVRRRRRTRGRQTHAPRVAAEYTCGYTDEILDRADLTPIVTALQKIGTAALSVSSATQRLATAG